MRSFPTAALLPKDETLAAQFLELYPLYDGRNTVVAIFDTGVDPGAIGLQTTSDGRPKILDIVDATGAGDVDTSLVVDAIDGKVTLPVSNRVLTLNPEWKPSVNGKYHVGSVAAFHLFPAPLVTRLKKERRETFERDQRAARNQIQEDLVKWKHENEGTCADAASLRTKCDLETRWKQLDDLSQQYDDPGPIYDVIVFFDGEYWRAAVDTTETGDFTDLAALTNFQIERQYATFSHASQLNYVLNIYDEGKTLSIVNDVGAHGTHVAAIVAAYHPDQPECNGIAPGAQIISVKIGDGRLGSMETSAALSRAISTVLQSRVDVVNMSYGEYASQHNYGRFVELANELVNDANVVFVSSAGNNGPGVGTVSSPGGTTTSLLGVGAYVSPQMMDAEYTLRVNNVDPGLAFTWTSCGPTLDGAMGVSICAPGAAIAPIPNWTLTKKQLMNGTSMASPNCAGNVALLLSALKAREMAFTPYSIRRALENTAVKLANVDVLAQGKGLLQVLPAFKYLETTASCTPLPLYYEVKTVPSDARGILLRERVDFIHESVEVTVKVTPTFHRDAPPEAKIGFEQHVRLVASTRWIHVGHTMALMQNGRTVNVEVETKGLKAGHHVGEILAYDVENEALGPVFTIPVIVLKPEEVTSTKLTYERQLEPGDVSRRFVTAPEGATWVKVTLKRVTSRENVESSAASKLYMLAVGQVQPFVRPSASLFHDKANLKAGQEVSFCMDVVGGLTTEVCVSQLWSTRGDSLVELTIQFHGILVDQKEMTIQGGEGVHKVVLSSLLEREILTPKVQFTHYVEHLRPEKAEILPLSSCRDQFPHNRQVYQLILTYKFDKKVEGKVVPSLPFLTNRLYESPFEGQLMQLFDDKKQYLGASDAYGNATTLKKGSYVVQAQVRHEEVGKLEKLQTMMLFVTHEVQGIPAPVFDHPDAGVLSKKPLETKEIPVGRKIALYIGEPAYEKLPVGISIGNVLLGKLDFGVQEGGKTKRPGGITISYVVPPAVPPVQEQKPNEPLDEQDEAERANEAVRDLLLERTRKLIGKPGFIAAWERLVAQFPTHVDILQAKLHHLDAETTRLSQLKDVIDAADAVLAAIQEKELALFFGTRKVAGDHPANEKKQWENKEKERSMLADALARKARALGDSAQWNAFLVVYGELEKWVDVDTPPYLHVALLHDRHFNAHGLALERLRKVQAMESAERTKILETQELAAEIVKTLEALQWTHWITYETQWERRRSPSSYRKF